jgi:hypothetical protein
MRPQPRLTGPAKTHQEIRNWVRIGLAGLGAMVALVAMLAVALFLLFTSTVPVPLPEVEVSEDDRDALVDRWMTFRGELASRQPTAPFQASSRDMNVFFSMMPRLRSRVYGTFEENRIRCQFCLPLSDSPKTRYLNGEVTIRPILKNRALQLDVTSCRVNGHALPPWVCRLLGRRSLNPEAYWVMEEFDIPRHLKSIDVRANSLVLNPLP